MRWHSSSRFHEWYRDGDKRSTRSTVRTFAEFESRISCLNHDAGCFLSNSGQSRGNANPAIPGLNAESQPEIMARTRAGKCRMSVWLARQRPGAEGMHMAKGHRTARLRRGHRRGRRIWQGGDLGRRQEVDYCHVCERQGGRQAEKGSLTLSLRLTLIARTLSVPPRATAMH